MKRRMIDASIWANEKFGKLPTQAQLLQIALITLADDQGRVKANPSYLRSYVFTYNDEITSQDIRYWLGEIEANSTIILYESDGKEYLQLVNWWEYQSLQYAMPSEYPAPTNWRDRIRYNAKGHQTLTYNWTTVSGNPIADTCDAQGNPIQIGYANPGGTPPSNPPGNPPGRSPGRIKEEEIKKNINKEEEERKVDTSHLESKPEPERATPAATAATDPNLARIMSKWQSNMAGSMTEVIADGIANLLDDYSVAEIEEAIAIAVRRNKRYLSYVQGILARGAFNELPSGSYAHPVQSMGEAAVDSFFARFNAKEQ